MNKKLINWIGLVGILSFISYTAAVVFSPMAFPGYKWMEQAVSDLSAESAPSRVLWERLSAFYGVGGMVCITCVAVFISENKISSKLFRLGIYLFAIMNLISNVGYKMFSLSDSGKEIESFQEVMHMVVTIAVVPLSIVSLVIIIIAGCKDKQIRGIGIWAAVALAMMFIGAIGTIAVPPEYFGIVERFSVFAAVGFNAVLGWYLFKGFERRKADE
ncbi:MAG: DUF998 domain-containing protein [Lachnospiraceae bacterium]|nr:DUF998 domain-containing protein [Lachnospiraceae bacterium]MBQ9233573.1 DUF998 domain-containing protein [Lachnospiraceae bacterium]